MEEQQTGRDKRDPFLNISGQTTWYNKPNTSITIRIYDAKDTLCGVAWRTALMELLAGSTEDCAGTGNGHDGREDNAGAERLQGVHRHLLCKRRGGCERQWFYQ